MFLCAGQALPFFHRVLFLARLFAFQQEFPRPSGKSCLWIFQPLQAHSLLRPAVSGTAASARQTKSGAAARAAAHLSCPAPVLIFFLAFYAKTHSIAHLAALRLHLPRLHFSMQAVNEGRRWFKNVTRVLALLKMSEFCCRRHLL